MFMLTGGELESGGKERAGRGGARGEKEEEEKARMGVRDLIGLSGGSLFAVR